MRGISFQVSKGEIVGFLGPNGAGKSTTMRMLTGYLPPSEGSVKIAGYDVLHETIEARRHIGYMPEQVPLYLEMRVSAFLEYRAALKGVPARKIRERVSIVMERCSLTDVSRKIIGHLSKGYRQRVGLADAMVHDPDLLILDEPTAGLDPNQIRAVRDLIKELGKDHTILISTHILPEVEAACGRALIIHRGRIEASDSLENLSSRVLSGALYLELKTKASDAESKFKALDCVSSIDIRREDGDWTQLSVTAKPGEDVRDRVYEVIRKESWDLREFRRGKASLEDVFVELTQD